MPSALPVNRPCKEVVRIIRQTLEAAEFRAVQSFDLRAALALLPKRPSRITIRAGSDAHLPATPRAPPMTTPPNSLAAPHAAH